MSDRCDRRAFLRRFGVAGLVAPTLPILGCRGEGIPAPAGDRDPITRPILVPWSADAVRIAAPLDEIPMAYVSMGLRQVFVDHPFRDRSNWTLDAHISVSTGVWRIPLPGDPAGVPIPPGDTLREFEELNILAWDPSMEPTDGDFRILRGRPAVVRIDFTCVPMPSADEWFSAGPWHIRQCDGVGDEACREDFFDVGPGTRHPRRGCAESGGAVRLMTWACRESEVE